MSGSQIISRNNGKIFDELLPNPYPFPAQPPSLAQVLTAGDDAGNGNIENLLILQTTNVVQRDAPNPPFLVIGGTIATPGVGGDLRIQGATTKGSLLVGNGTSTAEFAVPAPPPPNGSVLILDSTQPLGVRWGGESGPINTISAGNNIDISGTSANPIVAFQSPTTSNIRLGVGTEIQAKDNYDTPNFAMSIDATGLNDKYDVGGVVNQEDIAVSSTSVVQTLSTTDTSNYQNSSVLTCGTGSVIDQKTANDITTGYTAGAVVSCSPTSIQIGGGITYPIPSFPNGDGNISMNVALGGGSLNPSLSLSASAPFQPSYSTIIDKNGITQNNSGGAGFTINSNAENITLTNTGRIDLQSTNLLSDANKLEVRSTNVGGITNPLLVLKNTNATAGGATFETYKDDQPTSTGGDPVGIWTASCNTNIGKTEITRISAVANGVGAGNNDGSLVFACKVNSSLAPQNFINCNGGAGLGATPVGEVQFSKPINMFGQSIYTTTGDMAISTTNSSGTGIITVAPNTTGYVNIPSEADPTNDYIRINPQFTANSQQITMTAYDTPTDFRNNIYLTNSYISPELELSVDLGGGAGRAVRLSSNANSATNVLTAVDTQTNAPFQIDTSSYTNGSIDLKVNDTTGDILFTGTNLQSNTAGGNSGQHLRIKLNGTYYKIKLEDD
jgi:hypothetical protein